MATKTNLKEIETLIESAKVFLKEWDDNDNQATAVDTGVVEPINQETAVDVETDSNVEVPLEKQDSDLASVISTPDNSPAILSSPGDDASGFETVGKEDGFDIVQKKNVATAPVKINLSSEESLGNLYDALKFGEAELNNYPHWASEALADGFAEQDANTGKWKLSGDGQAFFRDYGKFKQFMKNQFETENTLFEVRMMVRKMFEKDGTYKGK